MKQTNLFESRLSLSTLGMMLLLAVVFVLGAQNSTAQTKVEFGELQSEQVLKAIESEMQFLEQEVRTPVGPVNTEKNVQVIQYYRGVHSAFRTGADIKVALKDIKITGAPEATLPADASNYTPTVMDDAQSTLRFYFATIDQLDLLDGNVDLGPVFDYWRTLKNQ